MHPARTAQPKVRLPTRPPPPAPRPHSTQPKVRTGTIERVAPDGSHAIVRGLFKKESDLRPFEGAAVTTGAGAPGVIAGRFGASGKVRVDFSQPLPPAAGGGGGGGGSNTRTRGPGDGVVTLRYKKYVFEDKSGGTSGGTSGRVRRVQQ